MLTDDELQAIRERCDTATPSPWTLVWDVLRLLDEIAQLRRALMVARCHLCGWSEKSLDKDQLYRAAAAHVRECPLLIDGTRLRERLASLAIRPSVVSKRGWYCALCLASSATREIAHTAICPLAQPSFFAPQQSARAGVKGGDR